MTIIQLYTIRIAYNMHVLAVLLKN